MSDPQLGRLAGLLDAVEIFACGSNLFSVNNNPLCTQGTPAIANSFGFYRMSLCNSHADKAQAP
jgi:hypothetical protein